MKRESEGEERERGGGGEGKYVPRNGISIKIRNIRAAVRKLFAG